jgi:hypothetical protein
MLAIEVIGGKFSVFTDANAVLEYYVGLEAWQYRAL